MRPLIRSAAYWLEGLSVGVFIGFLLALRTLVRLDPPDWYYVAFGLFVFSMAVVTGVSLAREFSRPPSPPRVRGVALLLALVSVHVWLRLGL